MALVPHPYFSAMEMDAILAAEPPTTATPWWVTLLAPMLAAIVGGLLVSGYLWRRNVRWENNRSLDFRSEIASDMARVANSLRFESIVYARKFKKSKPATSMSKQRRRQRHHSTSRT